MGSYARGNRVNHLLVRQPEKIPPADFESRICPVLAGSNACIRNSHTHASGGRPRVAELVPGAIRGESIPDSGIPPLGIVLERSARAVSAGPVTTLIVETHTSKSKIGRPELGYLTVFSYLGFGLSSSRWNL